MNDQTQMMNQHQMLNQPQMVNQQPPQMAPSQAQMVNQLSQQPMMVSQAPNPMIAQSKMMGQNNYGQWPQAPPNMPPPPMNAMKFANPMNQMYGGVSKPGRGNWKGKKPMDKRKDGRRKDKLVPGGIVGGIGASSGMAAAGPGVGSYQPPTLYELEQQNRLKARRFYPKKKFNRMGPYAHAPRNTTSYIIRAKKSGGIASLVSPCPVTPAVLPTPVFSPSREALVDMAKEEWGVDGYGSMKGLIRLRSPGHDEAVDDYDEEDEGGSSESDVEEHVEVERRLDHDLSRFEMIYPNSGDDYHNVLENRVDDQDAHIAQLEEENLILKERLYLMERELGELRRRLLCLERQNQVVEDINEEVVENVSENDSEGVRSMPLVAHKHNEEVDYAPGSGSRFSGERKDESEVLQKELRELAVKEVLHGESGTVGNNVKNVGCGEAKQDIGIVNEEVAFNSMADNKCEEQVQGLGAEHEEQHDLGYKKDVLSAIGTTGCADEGVKNEPLGDVCMGEVAVEEVKEAYWSEDVNAKIEVSTKHEITVAGIQAEDNTEAVINEAAGYICMGDVLPLDKKVKDD
uniref:PRLI-interacting factor A n=1 Tax=Opuntia streptacantha TaxID=393608 RepID=A0A7C8YHW3_OPUST